MNQTWEKQEASENKKIHEKKKQRREKSKTSDIGEQGKKVTWKAVASFPMEICAIYHGTSFSCNKKSSTLFMQEMKVNLFQWVHQAFPYTVSGTSKQKQANGKKLLRSSHSRSMYLRAGSSVLDVPSKTFFLPLITMNIIGKKREKMAHITGESWTVDVCDMPTLMCTFWRDSFTFYVPLSRTIQPANPSLYLAERR